MRAIKSSESRKSLGPFLPQWQIAPAVIQSSRWCSMHSLARWKLCMANKIIFDEGSFIGASESDDENYRALSKEENTI